MDAVATGLVLLLFLALFLGLGVWVFVGLILVSTCMLLVVAGFSVDRIGAIAKAVVWRGSSSWELAAIPLFIFMGEIIFRTDISDRVFRGLSPLVERVPGRLLHTNVLGCTLFAAVSGSSTATTATIGKITTAELATRGYSRGLSIGSLAGAGSLGLLIPPSIMMIIYGVLAEVSIAKLFIAGIVPGIIVVGLFSLFIAARCVFTPALAPASGGGLNMRLLLRAVQDLLPVSVLMVVVLGSIYSGIATPSEAAALGVAGTMAITIVLKQFSLTLMLHALMASVRTSCMICTLLASAAFLSSAVGYLHIPYDLAATIAAMGMGPLQLVLVLGIFYVMLGLFLDGISITVMTLPIILPLIVEAGLDPLWFGVFLVIMVEMGLITPPVGFNLFVLQGITGEPLNRIARAAVPFFMLMALSATLITLFPQSALWLPSLIK